MERDLDYILDETQWEGYVKGEDEKVVGYIASENPPRAVFCAACGFLVEAHWHTDFKDNEWYSCPRESDVRSWWGR